MYDFLSSYTIFEIGIVLIEDVFMFEIFHSDQESIVRVPLTRVATEDKPFISENFALYKIFKNLFLPQGYPDSVSEDYIRYQFWDTIQAFCSTINGNLQFNICNVNGIQWWFLNILMSCHHRYPINACHIEGCRCR